MNLPDDDNPTLLTIIGLLIAMALTTAAEVKPDPAFNSSLPEGASIHALGLSPDGGAIAGGSFATTAGQNLTLLNSNGQLDPSLSADINGPVLTTATDLSGHLLVGGGFSTVNGEPAQNLARLLPNGQLDTTFNPAAPNGRVRAIKLLPDGRLLLAGDFTRVGETPAIYLACFNNDGTLDSTFQSPLHSSYAMEAGLYALALQPDGKILAGGTFELPAAAATLVRLNPNGTLDSTFVSDPGAILYLEDIQLADGGSIFICGMASPYGDGFIRKLTPNGTPAEDFSHTVTDGPIMTISVSGSGILLGGDFSTVNGQNRGNLARLLADGQLDDQFDFPTDGPVEGLVALDDNVYVAGNFTTIGDQRANSIARLRAAQIQSTGTVSRAFTSFLPGTSGTSYLVESSTDLVNWSTFATKTAGENGVEIVDAALQQTEHRFFRAREIQ